MSKRVDRRTVIGAMAASAAVSACSIAGGPANTAPSVEADRKAVADLDTQYQAAVERNDANRSAAVRSLVLGHGFVLSKGTFVTVDFPGATGTSINGINDRGQIVGNYQDSDHFDHGFVARGARFMTVDYPGALGTVVWGINASGRIAGFYFTPDGAAHGFVGRPQSDDDRGESQED